MDGGVCYKGSDVRRVHKSFAIVLMNFNKRNFFSAQIQENDNGDTFKLS
jgi:hypothetical protein